MPKIVDHKQRRADIAAATIRVIARSGLRAADLRSVAAEAGWSAGAVAHYLPDKKALWLQALETVMERQSERMYSIANTGTLDDRLMGLLEAGTPFDDESLFACRFFYFFAAESALDPLLASELARYYRLWRWGVANLLTEGQRRQRFMGYAPDELASVFVGLAEGIGFQYIFDDDRSWREAARRQLIMVVRRFDATFGPSDGA